MSLAVFSSLVLLSFAVTTLGAGLFTAYFGAGTSRRIGFALAIGGLLAVFAFAAITFDLFPQLITSPWTTDQMLTGLAGVAGGIVGGLIALGVFLGSIVNA